MPTQKAKEVTICTACLDPQYKVVKPYHKIEVMEDLGYGKCPVCNWHTKSQKATLKKAKVLIDVDKVEQMILDALQKLAQQQKNDNNKRFFFVQDIFSVASEGVAGDTLAFNYFVQRAAKLAREGRIESNSVETKYFKKVNTYRLTSLPQKVEVAGQ